MRRVFYLLGELSDGDIDWLTVAGSRETYGQGHVLIEEGRQPDSLYIILEGESLVSVNRPHPREIARCGPGEILGELSFIDARPASATVRACGPLVVLRMRRAAVLARLESDRDFAARFYRALAVFLAQRLRRSTASFGFDSSSEDDEDAADELSLEVLDKAAKAGRRAEWLKARLQGQ